MPCRDTEASRGMTQRSTDRCGKNSFTFENMLREARVPASFMVSLHFLPMFLSLKKSRTFVLFCRDLPSTPHLPLRDLIIYLYDEWLISF